jgi:uncharacterized protein (TIGR00251 family)
MVNWYCLDAEGTVTISVHAQPGAKRSEVAGLHDAAVKIRVNAPALEDRANAALVEFLADRFDVPKRDVRLLAGERSRQKRFEIRGSRLAPAEALGIG